MRIHRDLTQPEEKPAQSVVAGGSKSTPEANGRGANLNDWHPFGRQNASKAALPLIKEPIPDEAPDTRLNLTLTGILNSTGHETRVVVRAGSDGEKLYGIGDKLPGDARIVAVKADRVILEKGGQHETLRLPRTVLPLDVKLAGGAQPAPVSEAAALLRELREQFQSNPDAVLSRIPMTVESKDGVFGGYRVQPGNEPVLLEKLGLMPGDVLTAVNGVALSSPAKGMEALGGLSKSQVLHVTLLRGGKAVTVHHELAGN
ncbi:MAG: type II secretion system protein GspC [Magnetococcus sp. YQC-9]